MDENRSASALLHRSHSLCEQNSHTTHGHRAKTARSTLQMLNPNVCLTRLNVDTDVTNSGGSVNIRCERTDSPLRRRLLTRRAVNADRHRNDDTAVTKSKRHGVPKSSSRHKCLCFRRPSVCSICLTRSI